LSRRRKRNAGERERHENQTAPQGGVVH
jgi:hypothetical protein